MARGGISVFRLLCVFLAFVAGFAAVLFRLADLQLADRGELAEVSERIRTKFQVIEAKRGNIYDQRHNLLAAANRVWQVGVDPESLNPEDKPNWPRLAQLLDIPYEELRPKMLPGLRVIDGVETPIRWKTLADDITEVGYEEILALEIDGVYGNLHYKRVYPGKTNAAHVLGFVNKELTPVTGVELAMDFYLSGQKGWLETEYDGKRQEMVQFRKRQVDPVDGFHVFLTLDLMVQHVIDEELKKIAAMRPDGATIIVSNPSNGFILGLGNWPNYDPNEFYDTEKYPLAHRRNLAITDIYEPGSTFKIVPISAALSEEIVNPDREIDCSLDRVRYQGRIISLPDDYKDFGVLTVRNVVAYSSNRGSAYIGMMLGDQRLYRYARAFGFGEKTGFILSGEVTGILHKPARWDGLTVSRLPMGHAVACTPLQTHMAMTVMANNGVLMEPMIVSRVEDTEGNTIVEFQPKVRRRVISSIAALSMSEFLIKAAGPGGTAQNAQIPGMEVAGKTGTTQKIMKNGKYSHSEHVASFTGYFPARDPRLAITVVIDNPKTRYTAYGGRVAAPVFKRVAEQLIHIRGISPSSPNRSIALDKN